MEVAVKKPTISPFSSFTSIKNQTDRCGKIVNQSAFQADVKNDALPHLSYYSPAIRGTDIINNETTTTRNGGYFSDWLNTWYQPYITTTWRDVLLMVVWTYANETNNHVTAFFKHPSLPVGSTHVRYDHYSISRFVEENWNLGNLNRSDVTAESFSTSLPSLLYTSPPSLTTPRRKSKPPPSPSHTNNKLVIGFSVVIVVLALSAALAFWGYSKHKAQQAEEASVLVPTKTASSPLVTELETMSSGFYLGGE